MPVKVADLVIGSGPTGFAAALGVLSRGGHPAIIDFGVGSFSPPKERVGSSQLAEKGAPGLLRLSLAYPSSLVSADDGGTLPVSATRGGLSRVWGAGVLHRDDEELRAFGRGEAGVRRGYAALQAAIPLAGNGHDATSRRFPWPEGLAMAPQSQRYERVTAHLQDVTTGDVLFGYPRMALDLTGPSGCLRCGQCLSGCPEHLFFDASIALERLVSAGRASWIDGPAMSLSQDSAGVKVYYPHGSLLAERVYVAAGPVATIALLQRSRLIPHTVSLFDSAVFYSAFLNFNRPLDDVGEYASSHLVAHSRSTGPGDFQMGFYESHPVYRDRLRGLVGAFPARLLPDPLLLRINASIGLLAPEFSGRLRIRLSADGRSWVTRHATRLTQPAARSAIKRAGEWLGPLGIKPVPRGLIVPPPGSGFHVGGGLPVGGELVDFDGRLKDAPRVHVVDASSLPKVWAGSHTFTAMANAHRIANGGGT